MTKYFCVFMALLCAVCPSCGVCYALDDVEWVRVINDDTLIYTDSNATKAIFTLPKSYYLPVAAKQDDMYRVTVMSDAESSDFPSIIGYVYVSEVDECNETPTLPHYPMEKITVDTDSAAVKLSPTVNAQTVVTVTNTQKMSYYGKIADGDDLWYYVCFCGKLGYVNADSVTAPVISLHPTPLPQQVVNPQQPSNDDTNPEPTPPKAETNSATEIILIIFVALMAVGIALALFLPGNFKKKGDEFDEM